MLTDALVEGRLSEAILTRRQEIQKRANTLQNNVTQPCGNCGRPFTKSLSCTQRLRSILPENRTLEDFFSSFPKAQRSNFSKNVAT